MNSRLEELSDKVRMGIPISINEAMEVIEYQEELKRKKITFKIKKLIEISCLYLKGSKNDNA